MIWDSTYYLIILAFMLSALASWGVQATFSKYKDVLSRRGMTGMDAARRILDANGLYGVRIEHISGNLNDHYDPRDNVIRLSDATYSSASVASIGVAAHEAGHAIQHAKGYLPIKIRNAIIPAANIGSTLSMPLFFIGLLLGLPSLALAGVTLFSAILVFQIATLPVEFNASRRALAILDNSGILDEDEVKSAGKVLRAAAMTYVAAVAATALQLLRLLTILNRRRN